MTISAETRESVVGNTIATYECLFDISLLLRESLGSLLPGIRVSSLPTFQKVLEIGCGSGGWTTEMAYTHSTAGIDVIGIDSDISALRYAQEQAADLHLANVTYYHVHHLSDPFGFLPSETYDLISAQFLSWKLCPSMVQSLLQECMRLLRPGGMLRILDCGMDICTNMPAHDELVHLFFQAMHMNERSLDPTTRRLDMLHTVELIMRDVGFQQREVLDHTVNYSFGTPLYREWRREFLILCKQFLPFLVQYGLATSERVNTLYMQQAEEMKSPFFSGEVPMVTVVGKRKS